MRVKNIADLGQINAGTPQAKQLQAAFATYEREARLPNRQSVGKGLPVSPARPPRGTTRDPQQILAAMVQVDSELGDLGWHEDYVGAVPGRKFEIDLALPDLRLGIETDGWQYHGKHKESFLRDRDKDYLLTLQGWVIVRIQAGLITANPDEAMARVRQFLAVWMPRQRLALSSF